MKPLGSFTLTYFCSKNDKTTIFLRGYPNVPAMLTKDYTAILVRTFGSHKVSNTRYTRVQPAVMHHGP